jgi:hypothetical protein
MKPQRIFKQCWLTASALLALLTVNSQLAVAQAQGTAFTYQGRLNNGTNPVTGAYDMTFSLYTASAGGTQTGGPVTNLAVGVTNGLFTTSINFGAVFSNSPAWLAIGVRTNGATSFTGLNPLQQLTPTPFAITAENLSGMVPAANLPSALTWLTDPGTGNYFDGVASGNPSVTGTYNVGAGGDSLEYIGTGSFNTADGVSAAQFDSTGTYNAGFGAYALQWVTTGSSNTASGVYALSAEPTYLTGNFNTADGASALYSLGSGSENVALGYQAMYRAAADSGVVAVGFQALQNDAGTGGFLSVGSANDAVGYQALQANTTGGDNTAVGYQALYSNVAANNNSAFGTWALLSDNTGSQNTALGAFSLQGNSSGNNDTAVGEGALSANTGSQNTAIGVGALAGGAGSAGGGNTAGGAYALGDLTTGYNNVALGLQALFTNTVGFDNVSVGVATLMADAQGHQNTAVGTYAFQNLTAGSGNTGIGLYAGYSLTSGSNNIYIGNFGVQGDNNVIRIGSGDSQIFLSGAVQGNVGINGGLNVDPNGLNIGNVNADALTFGTSSGEGICSKRSGTNPYDLELWTDFNERVKVAQNGNVGIGTDNPTEALDVNGEFMVVEGATPLRCYFGDDGSGNDVQIGSLTHGVTAVSCYNETDNAYMHLYCSSITIEGGADLAEPFSITKTEQPVAEGDVVVIDDTNPGQLKLTDQPYDTRVAGVVSGANGINPGIQMHQQGLLEGGKNVALTGRVYVQADTSNGAIKPGDLLTTSGIPGRAMRVSDHARAQGAILGKAMTALKTGRGMVLVLVTLQ